MGDQGCSTATANSDHAQNTSGLILAVQVALQCVAHGNNGLTAIRFGMGRGWGTLSRMTGGNRRSVDVWRNHRTIFCADINGHDSNARGRAIDPRRTPARFPWCPLWRSHRPTGASHGSRPGSSRHGFAAARPPLGRRLPKYKNRRAGAILARRRTRDLPGRALERLDQTAQDLCVGPIPKSLVVKVHGERSGAPCARKAERADHLDGDRKDKGHRGYQDQGTRPKKHPIKSKRKEDSEEGNDVGPVPWTEAISAPPDRILGKNQEIGNQ